MVLLDNLKLKLKHLGFPEPPEAGSGCPGPLGAGFGPPGARSRPPEASWGLLGPPRPPEASFSMLGVPLRIPLEGPPVLSVPLG